MRKTFGLFLTALTLTACTGGSAESGYTSDCSIVEQRFDTMLSALKSDILTFKADERLVERVVRVNGETRRFKGPAPAVVSDWHKAAESALEGNIIWLYGDSWPRVSNEDLQLVLKELSREEFWSANTSALRAMCPALSERLDGASAVLFQTVEDKAKSLEVPSDLEPMN